MEWVKDILIGKEKGWLINRRIAKRQFVIGNKRLCKIAFLIGTSHKDYKSIPGIRLIEKARIDLKYSNSTYSGDIYFGLWKQYEDLFIRK